MIPDAHLKAVLDFWSEQGERSICCLEGNCMAPLLREGDSLAIEHGNQDIRVGDIIVFGAPGRFYVQRVVHIASKDGLTLFTVRGDGHAISRPPLPRQLIMGKVIAVEGSNGYLRFDSVFWRGVSYILSLRAYISGRRRQADTSLWKAIDAMFKLRAKTLPKNCSLSLLPLRAMCWANKLRSRMSPRRRPRKAEA